MPARFAATRPEQHVEHAPPVGEEQRGGHHRRHHREEDAGLDVIVHLHAPAELALKDGEEPTGPDEGRDRAHHAGLERGPGEPLQERPGRQQEPDGEDRVHPHREVGGGRDVAPPLGRPPLMVKSGDGLVDLQRDGQVDEVAGRHHQVEQAVVPRRQEPGIERHEEHRDAPREQARDGVDGRVPVERFSHGQGRARSARTAEATRSCWPASMRGQMGSERTSRAAAVAAGKSRLDPDQTGSSCTHFG